MLRYHMIVVTPDTALKRAVKRLTTATGATADYATRLGGAKPTRPIDLAILDGRRGPPDRAALEVVPENARILYILRPEDLTAQVGRFEDPRVTSLFTYDAQFDDDEFISSATKALRGDVFGLQKYFPWGVTTFTMVVKSYREKGRAIQIMLRYAKMAGVRGPVRDRLQLVADELMMNALYHAPTDEEGRERYRDRDRKELATDQVEPIQVQYGCSGRYFGISVRDGGGSLSRSRALEYLQRANRATEIEDKSTGAGLGLISVLRSVSKLIFNLDPGHSTEVVGLFDMELVARGQVGARSLHLFTAAADEADDDDDAATGRPAAASARAWAMAAVLGAIVAALGTAYYMKAHPAPAAAAVEQPAAAAPTLTVDTTPEDATLLIHGAEHAPGEPWRVPDGTRELQVEVRREGFQTRQERVQVEVGKDLLMIVDLVPAP